MKSLTHCSPVLLYYTPWKQKTERFSDVFRECRKATPGCNRLNENIDKCVHSQLCVKIFLSDLYISFDSVKRLYQSFSKRLKIFSQNNNNHSINFSQSPKYASWLRKVKFSLTHSWRRSLLFRNQSVDLLSKSMDWFLYDRDLHRERVKISYSKLNSLKNNEYWVRYFNKVAGVHSSPDSLLPKLSFTKLAWIGLKKIVHVSFNWTLSWRKFVWYRNKSIDLLCKWTAIDFALHALISLW